MKKLLFLLLFACISLSKLYAQYATTNVITDWNNIWKSGFFQSKNAANAPKQGNPPTFDQFFWGINISMATSREDWRFNGQLLINNSPNEPEMFFRATVQERGEGKWAKVLHDLGNQAIKGNLTVAGKVHAREVQVTVNAGADYVFEDNYELRPLSEVEAFITHNKHLPEIPSEKDMLENGLNMNEFQIKLLQKIEELTLYTINQQTLIEKMQEKIDELEKEFK